MSWEFCDGCGCSPCDCDWGLYEEPKEEDKEEDKDKDKETKQKEPPKKNPFWGKPIC